MLGPVSDAVTEPDALPVLGGVCVAMTFYFIVKFDTGVDAGTLGKVFNAQQGLRQLFGVLCGLCSIMVGAILLGFSAVIAALKPR